MWNDVKRSNREITPDLIADLASKCNITSGKWLFYADTGPKADHLWRLVATAVVKGNIPCNSAKISTVDDLAEDEYDRKKHVVCIYNNNYLDQNQVLECENGIRKIGIKCQLLYKPDIFTHLDIYAGNPWNIKPTIYRSDYNVLIAKSVVKFNHA